MFLSLGEKGQQRAYHLSPDVRPAAETFAEYVEALSALFVPAQESDMAKVDFKKCKQGKKEPIQTFHARKVRLFMDAFGVNPMNVGDHMDVFFDSYLESVYRKEVKADLLEPRPYERVVRPATLHLQPEGAGPDEAAGYQRGDGLQQRHRLLEQEDQDLPCKEGEEGDHRLWEG